jgi:imidazolonepropionase-like amidohydrolase
MLTLIEFGLPPERAIRAASTDAWEFLRLPQISIGARPDLLILSADPLEYPETYLNPAAILRAGELVEGT